MECIKEKPLLGATVTFGLLGVDELFIEEAFAKIYNEALRLQSIFNFYDAQSELSSLNTNRTGQVSDELLEVIKFALPLCKLTNGNYDISIGKQTLARKKNLPLPKINCSYKDIIIKENQITLRHPDVQIDLGSIAKGFIADKILGFMNKTIGIEEGWVDARGDFAFFGKSPHTIEIQHPREKGSLGSFKLACGGVATSGDYRQYTGSFDNSHILGKGEIISATVIATTAMEADAFATCFMVSSQDIREKLSIENPTIKVLLVDKKLNRKTYNRFPALKYS